MFAGNMKDSNVGSDSPNWAAWRNYKGKLKIGPFFVSSINIFILHLFSYIQVSKSCS